MEKRPRLADVAREAGVSVSTASRALNHPHMVRPALLVRIREVSERLGYTPNPFARSLREQASRSVGLIVPDNTEPFFAEVAKAIESACFRAGYSLVLCDADTSPEREVEPLSRDVQDAERVLLGLRLDACSR
jgi:LacI family transcriptional regulator